MRKIRVPESLSEERNEEFRRLYKKHYNMDITVEEANEEFRNLGSFFAIIIENTPRYWTKPKS